MTVRTSSHSVSAFGGETQVNTVLDNDQSNPVVASLEGGGYVVAWQSVRPVGPGGGLIASIFFQRFDALGQPINGEISVATETLTNQLNASVTGLADGGFVITWDSYSRDEDHSASVFGQRYDSSGVPVGDEFQVNTYTASDQVAQSSASLDDGGFVVVWQSANQDGSQEGVFGQRYGATGDPIGDEFQVNTELSNAQQNPSVTGLSDGGFVVTWTSMSQDHSDRWGGIYGQRYDAVGEPVGEEFLVNTYTNSNQRFSSVTALEGGGYVVTWTSWGQDGDEIDDDDLPGFYDSDGVFGQVYGADGVPLGGEFQVNTTEWNEQRHPTVTALSDGGFVVVWETNGINGYDYDIFAQVFDASGQARNGEFRVNATSEHNQTLPSVAALDDGSFVVTWDSYASGSRLVMSQHFIPNNISTGEVLISGTPSQHQELTADASAIADTDGLGVLTYSWLRDGEVISGASDATYVLTQEDVGAEITAQVSYVDGNGITETITSAPTASVANINDAPTGGVSISGNSMQGEVLSAGTSLLADLDGLGDLFYQWQRDGSDISGATGASYTLMAADIGATVTLVVSYTDGYGAAEAVTSATTAVVLPWNLTLTGTAGNDTLYGEGGDDLLNGLEGNDRLIGNDGSDTLFGGDGADTLNGGEGDDFIFGGDTEEDLSDLIYAGAGNDSIDGGYGNDLIFGQDGDDLILGGFGVDDLRGQAGNDTITGSALSDLIYGGAGNDFVNGGFGHDRVNGGSGADRFYHLGIADHGSDWIQDYNAGEGDVLMFGNSSATVNDFLVNISNAGNAGDTAVDEAFVIYRPTGEIIWALVDGAGQDEINLRIGGQVFDLLS